MTLKSIHFRSYYDKNKEDHDIAGGLYLPCFEHSVLYRRATAYYRLSAMSCYLSAIPGFVRRGGKIQIVCSPDLKASDAVVMMKAIIDGEINPDLKKIYEDQILNEIESANEEEKSIDKIVSALMRLGVLEIKIAIPHKKDQVDRFFHKKLGYFEDVDGNKLTFNGSGNETYAGLDKNGNDEWIEVLTTWDQNNETALARILMIDELWNKKTANTKVYDFPEAAQEQILNLTEDMANLSGEEGVDHLADLINEYERKKIVNESLVSLMPGVELRKHQQEAIKNWLGSGRRGIFDHCTGSGKTLTAVWLILDSLRRRETPLIIVPKTLLLSYWGREIRRFLGDQNVHILLCGGGNNRWKTELPLELCSRDIRNDLTKDLCVIIAVDKTVCTEEFQNRICTGEHLFIIGDECHNYGSNKNSSQILTMECGPRLGLSATPNRHGDDVGAKKILEYFGDIVPPVVSIKDGISAVPPFLSSYFYYPHFCELSDKEIEEYEDLTRKIARKYGGKDNVEASEFKNDILFFQRARIIKKAESKIALAVDILKKEYQEGQKWILFCEDEQIYSIENALREENIGPRMIYLSKDKDKKNAFDFFTHHSGIMLAIRCLDEGIDIPDATHALLLASSQNPAQFIQRRGRVLRIAEGKENAYIHDAFLKPPKGKRFDKVLRAEISRGMEFANDAINNLPSGVKLQNILNEYKYESGKMRKDEEELDFDTFSTPDSPVTVDDSSEGDLITELP